MLRARRLYVRVGCSRWFTFFLVLVGESRSSDKRTRKSTARNSGTTNNNIIKNGNNFVPRARSSGSMQQQRLLQLAFPVVLCTSLLSSGPCVRALIADVLNRSNNNQPIIMLFRYYRYTTTHRAYSSIQQQFFGLFVVTILCYHAVTIDRESCHIFPTFMIRVASSRRSIYVRIYLFVHHHRP